MTAHGKAQRQGFASVTDETSEEAATPEGAVDALLGATLDLLAGLPERPQRLRVRAGGIVIDLDWRSRALPLSPPALPVPAAVSVPPVLGAEIANANGHDSRVVIRQETTTEVVRPPTHQVCAPTVGTYYEAPEPGAAPFVTVGSRVTVGQQVGIVEAMKLMLPVEADRAGWVVELLVTNGQSVEYGEPLLVLGPESV